jgi:hypothetical protein
MTPFQNWTYRCTARWMVIAGALLVALSLMVAVRADASKEETATVAAAGSTSRPACGLGTSPSCPRGVYQLGILAPGLTLAVADSEPVVATGLGTSPSLPATTQWYATAAGVLIMLIGVAKKSPRIEKFFATDGIGMASSFVVAVAYTFGEALARGESPSMVLLKHSFLLTVAMFAGYAGLLKRVALPLLRQFVTKVLGLPVPGWLA